MNQVCNSPDEGWRARLEDFLIIFPLKSGFGGHSNECHVVSCNLPTQRASFDKSFAGKEVHIHFHTKLTFIAVAKYAERNFTDQRTFSIADKHENGDCNEIISILRKFRRRSSHSIPARRLLFATECNNVTISSPNGCKRLLERFIETEIGDFCMLCMAWAYVVEFSKRFSIKPAIRDLF